MGKEFINDIRTYAILSRNENYKDRLFEAYEYIKSEGIENVDDFCNRKGLLVGAFTYDEITIFDRINDQEYVKSLAEAYSTITRSTQDYIDNKHIGDELASWGRLGETPYRENLINQGYIVEGLSEEEARRHFGV